jgi:hypothetical protein
MTLAGIPTLIPQRPHFSQPIEPSRLAHRATNGRRISIDPTVREPSCYASQPGN